MMQLFDFRLIAVSSMAQFMTLCIKVELKIAPSYDSECKTVTYTNTQIRSYHLDREQKPKKTLKNCSSCLARAKKKYNDDCVR